MTEYNDIFKNGSTWLKADFHLHTKADKEFVYSGQDSYYISSYVDALINSNIGIGVIANHNKFDLKEFKVLNKEALKKNVFLLPGVELSVKDGANGIHCLIVFDYKTWVINNENFIEQFLISAFEGISNRENGNVTCRYNLSDLCQKLEEHRKSGRDSFIVMAHIGEIGYCGVQNDIPKESWLKIGDFTFDAVKYALLDKKNRVSPSKPTPKNAYIKSIAFQGGLLDGKEIALSPELNNFIGIRGSGKSSILEILRYALSIDLADNVSDKIYKNSLIENVLKSGGKVVVVVVDKHGAEYRIEKIYGKKEDVYCGDQLQDISSVNSLSLNSVYFGQKDLSNKDVDFEADLIKKLIGNKLETVNKEIKAKKREVIDILINLSKLKNLDEDIKETEAVIQDAKHQLQLYNDKGIKEKLSQQNRFEADILKVEDFKGRLHTFINELCELYNENKPFFEGHKLQSEENKDIFDDINNQFSFIASEFIKLDTIVGNINERLDNVDALYNKLNDKKEALKEEFAKVKREINIPNLNPDDFLRINRIIETSNLKLVEYEKSKEEKEKVSASLKVKLKELNSLWLREFNLLKNEIDRINDNSNVLAIEIEFKGRKDVLKSRLVDLLKGSGMREASYDKIATYKDFIDIYFNIENLNSLAINENHLLDFKNRYFDNLQDLLIFRVPDKFLIKYNGKPLSQHSLGQRATALIIFLLAQKETDILIIDQPEDDLDNQTIYKEVIQGIRALKGSMQFIFATHNANIPVLGDSERIVACKYNDKNIELSIGTIDSQNSQKDIIEIMEGGEDAFNRRKDIYSMWSV